MTLKQFLMRNSYPKTYISLEQLRDITGLKHLWQEKDLYNEVQQCVADGLMSPVKSSRTNGNIKYPLYYKYRITVPKEQYDQEQKEIAGLHPTMLESGYLQNKPQEFRRWRNELLLLNQWLFLHTTTPVAISRKERSFEIFGEEKQLEDSTFRGLLQKMGVTETVLAYYSTPEYCFNDYIPKRKPELTLLICENKDIWFNIRRMMFEQNCSVLFGQPLDGVVYGCGNRVAEAGALTAYTMFMGAKVHFLYWGDIDREGLNIFVKLTRANPEMDIRPFTPAYSEMLRRASDRKIPDSQDERQRMEDYTSLLDSFSSQRDVEMLKDAIAQNMRIPQEIITFADLLGIMENKNVGN